MLFALLADVLFAGALQVDSLEGSSRKCVLRDVAGDEWSPHSAIRSIEVPEGPAMASEGPVGRGVTSSSFEATDIVVGGMMGSHQGWPHRGGSPLALHTRRRNPIRRS